MEAEERASELAKQLETERAERQELAEARRDDRAGWDHGEEEPRQRAEQRELEHALQESKEKLAEADEEARQLRELFYELQRSSATEREAVLQQAELSRYRALDEERRIWEGREQRLGEELRAARARGRRRSNRNTINDRGGTTAR